MDESTHRSAAFALAHDYVDRAAALSPIMATFWGVEDYDDRLDDFSVEEAHDRAALMRDTIAALDHLTPVDDVDRIAVSVMSDRLGSLVSLVETGEWRRTFSVIWSPASEIRNVFELQPSDSAEHADRIRSRLADVRRSLGTWRATLDDDAAGGLVPARRQVLGVAGQLETYAAGGFASVAQQKAASCGVDAETLGLAAAAADADLACGELAAWLRATYADRCSPEDSVGAERYGPWARFATGATLDLDETYGWAIDDLTRINDRMWELAGDVAPDAATLAEVAEVLDADDDRALRGTDALLQHLQGIITGAIEMLDGRYFDIDPRARRCDARLAPEGSATAAYYTDPSEDFTRPGATWFPVFGRDRFPLWQLLATWYHESVPGHHLQVTTSLLERDRQSRFQRLQGFVPAYSEGWALYAERLMQELGAYSDPGDELGYLSGQALRAARVVVDIGMHLRLAVPSELGLLGDLGDVTGRIWDAETAVALLVERALIGRDEAVSEVDRYLGMPSQAICYKVGERVWLECREDARRRLGAAFDLKAWHAHALALGPMGLDPFAVEMAAYSR